MVESTSMQTKQKRVSLNWAADFPLKLILISSHHFRESRNSVLIQTWKIQCYSPAASNNNISNRMACWCFTFFSFSVISAKWSLSAGHVFSMKGQVQKAISHFLFSSWFYFSDISPFWQQRAFNKWWRPARRPCIFTPHWQSQFLLNSLQLAGCTKETFCRH